MSPSPKLTATRMTPDDGLTGRSADGSFGDGENALGGESKPESIATERRIAHRAKAEETRGTGASDARPPYSGVGLLPTDLSETNLRQRVSDNTCPISGLTDAELADHFNGVARLIGNAKGWDRIRAEYGDVLGEARQRTRRPCTVCGKFTRALSGICPDHPLEHA